MFMLIKLPRSKSILHETDTYGLEPEGTNSQHKTEGFTTNLLKTCQKLKNENDGCTCMYTVPGFLCTGI